VSIRGLDRKHRFQKSLLDSHQSSAIGIGSCFQTWHRGSVMNCWNRIR
jgi:hypothetical protein